MNKEQNMNIEQLRAEFEEWCREKYNNPGMERAPDGYAHTATHQLMPMTYASVQMLWEAYQAGRAALQSQTVIDDDHLSIVLDVYDNAMQKAFDGREFKNPCKPGTPEHKAWEKGSKEGKKKRDAGLPNSIALQSQDRGAVIEEGFRWRSINPPYKIWNYVWDRDPDSWELREAEIQNVVVYARRVEGERG